MCSNACLAKSELGSLQGVRNSVIAWRNESLASVSLPASSPVSSPASLLLQSRSYEAFGIRCAARVFQSFAIVAEGRGGVCFHFVCRVRGTCYRAFASDARAGRGGQSNNPALSEQQLNALVEQRVQEELQRMKASQPRRH